MVDNSRQELQQSPQNEQPPLNSNHYRFDIWNPGRGLGQALSMTVLNLLQYMSIYLVSLSSIIIRLT